MLYIHIGFHKTGSTTIQHFCAANADILARHSLIYPKTGRNKDAHFKLTSMLKNKPGGNEKHGGWEDIVQEILSQPSKNFLISSESFHTFDEDNIVAVRELLSGVEVGVIAYIRDPSALLPSRYAQKAKSGSYVEDFDTFFEDFSRPLVNVSEHTGLLGDLTRWAKVFDWERLRVRSLDRRILTGGDLIKDFADAIGLPISVLNEIDQGALAPKNTSPGWKTIELLRSVHANSGARRSVAEFRRGNQFATIRKQSSIIKNIGEKICGDLGFDTDRGRYLTVGQWEICQMGYHATLNRLNCLLDGPKLPPPEDTGFEPRSFLPTAQAVPLAEKAEFYERMSYALAESLELLGEMAPEVDPDGQPITLWEAAQIRKREKRKGDRSGDQADSPEKAAQREAVKIARREEREAERVTRKASKMSEEGAGAKA